MFNVIQKSISSHITSKRNYLAGLRQQFFATPFENVCNCLRIHSQAESEMFRAVGRLTDELTRGAPHSAARPMPPSNHILAGDFALPAPSGAAGVGRRIRRKDDHAAHRPPTLANPRRPDANLPPRTRAMRGHSAVCRPCLRGQPCSLTAPRRRLNLAPDFCAHDQ